MEIRRIFWGLKFSIAGIFGVGKFSKYFFGRLDLRRNFFAYFKQSEVVILHDVIDDTEDVLGWA